MRTPVFALIFSLFISVAPRAYGYQDEGPLEWEKPGYLRISSLGSPASCTILLGFRSQVGVRYISGVYSDGVDYDGGAFHGDTLAGLAERLTDAEWTKLAALLERLPGDSRSAGYRYVANYRIKSILALMPHLIELIDQLEMKFEHFLELLKLATRYRVESVLPYFLKNGSLSPASLFRQHHQKTNQLAKILEAARPLNLGLDAMMSVGFFLRAGLSYDQAKVILALHFRYLGLKGLADPTSFKHLRNFLVSVADFGVDPKLTFEFLRKDYLPPNAKLFQAGAFLSMLALELERQVETTPQTPNGILEKMVEWVKTGTRLTFTPSVHIHRVRDVQRYLRPSRYFYRVKLGYEEGLQQLYEVARDPSSNQEGLFSFDPQSQTWMNIAAFTDYSAPDQKSRTEFEFPPRGSVGDGAVIVRIHPRRLENTQRPFSPILRFIDKSDWLKWLSVLPSETDFADFHRFERYAQPVRLWKWAIVHSYGITEMFPGVRGFAEMTGPFREWIDSFDQRTFEDETKVKDQSLFRILWNLTNEVWGRK